MRAVCEACGKPQPPGWTAGELCAHCGKAVRAEVRCFWCAKWTPAAKFCRGCGAETVPAPQFGAARMLKDAGTDRFTVPKMLRELDPEQVENFSRIYQRHAVAVARHVDELRFLERFLFRKDYSAALEDELIPQLPWPEAALARYAGPVLPPGDDLATAKAIEASSPFPRTQSLAAVARVRLDDFDAVRAALGAFASGDPAVRVEAALSLTGWRVRTAVGALERGRELVRALDDAPFPLEVAVRKALAGMEVDPGLLREAQASRDPETAFAASLALGEIDRLQAALRDGVLERMAAGCSLAELGVLPPLEEPLRSGPPDLQLEIVETLLRRKEPAAPLSEALLRIVETTPDKTLRERAVRLLRRQLPPEWALRIARAAGKERYIFQSLLSEEAALPPEAASEVAGFMIDGGLFTMNQYGLREAAERGAVPDGFVPARFEGADAETRIELLRFAEEQLKARGDEALHRFVMGVVFGPYDAVTRAAAWWGLSRWYKRDDVASFGPFALHPGSIRRFFGSTRAFVPKLAAVMRDRATLKEVGVYDFLARFLKEADPSFAPALAEDEASGRDLVRALLEALLVSDYWAYLRTGIVDLLGLLGAHPAWRYDVVAGLRALLGKESFDLTYACERALKRIEGRDD
jgi:hypothetical protein